MWQSGYGRRLALLARPWPVNMGVEKIEPELSAVVRT